MIGGVDPLVRGVILSGCGGDARLGVLHRDDLPIVTAFAAIMGFSRGELDALHPFMTLLQALADPIDPATYARLYREPLPGRKPQRVLHYQGLDDSFTPGVTAEALAIAIDATPVLPITRPSLSLPRAIAIDDLLEQAAPRAFVQLAPTRREDGHFVIYHEPEAAEIMRRFLRAIAIRP